MSEAFENRGIVKVDVNLVRVGPPAPVRHEIRFTDDVKLHVGDEPIHVRRGTVVAVEKSTGDSVDVHVPLTGSVLTFNLQHAELFERFHPITESA